MSEQGVLPGFDELTSVASAEGISSEEAARISRAARAGFEGQAEPPPWMAEYEALLGEGWPWRVACYIAWASVPRSKRQPRTLRELASVLGLASSRAIHTWRKKNPEIDARVQAVIIEPLMEARADIIEALIASATSPDHRSHPDRKLALEMAKLHTPRAELEATITRAGIFLPEVEEPGEGELASGSGEQGE